MNSLMDTSIQKQDPEISAFLALHEPERQNDHMVYEVWHDGEVTLTKGGDLWRQRSLHMLRVGVIPELAMPVDIMPIQYGENGSIIVRDNDRAQEAANLVVLYATKRREEAKGH